MNGSHISYQKYTYIQCSVKKAYTHQCKITNFFFQRRTIRLACTAKLIIIKVSVWFNVSVVHSKDQTDLIIQQHRWMWLLQMHFLYSVFYLDDLHLLAIILTGYCIILALFISISNDCRVFNAFTLFLIVFFRVIAPIRKRSLACHNDFH